MKEIILQSNVRCFKRAFPDCPILANTGFILSTGDKVWVGEAVTMTYDHSDLLAVPYAWQGNQGFLLHREVEPSLESLAPAPAPALVQ